MTFSARCNRIFDACVAHYHSTNNVDAVLKNPYDVKTIEHDLFFKNWIDAVQWHLEDIIRDPAINPAEALLIKRRIDCSNQERTDLVEQIDHYFMAQFASVPLLSDAGINTETPAWAIDRLSILALKIYHMQAEADRPDATREHCQQCRRKLDVLMAQRTDLSTAIDRLLDDLAAGRKYMKLYKQMKMYNDPSLNPVLYNKGER